MSVINVDVPFQYRILPYSMLHHVLIGGFFTCLTLLAWAYENKHLMIIAYRKFRSR